MDDERQTPEQMAAVLVQHPVDNVVVCRCDVRAGQILEIEGRAVTARCDVALGHKIAREVIPAGAPVIKYGMSIGVSTTDILPGDWVHMHNMKSAYIPSHTRQSSNRT